MIDSEESILISASNELMRNDIEVTQRAHVTVLKPNVLRDVKNCLNNPSSSSQLTGESAKKSAKDNVRLTHCDLCARDFASPSSLNRHLHDVHDFPGGNAAKFVCPTCSQTFKRSSHLESHRLRRHLTGGEAKPFFCEFCSKSFADASLFKRHQRAHKRETPFLCPYCQRGFAHSKTQLRNHVMTHTGERPFRCQVCGKGFITKVKLTKHVVKCGKEEPRENDGLKTECDVENVNTGMESLAENSQT